jgi:hypothetical protein
MCRRLWLSAAVVAGALAATSAARAQVRPYIGYAYPAGGQQGTTVQVKLGGQGLDDVNEVLVTGPGVRARLVEYQRRLNFQDIQLLNEQLKELKKGAPAASSGKDATTPTPETDEETQNLIARIQKRVADFVPTPACASISSIAYVEVTLAADAEPGGREIRLVTPRGVSNPLVFEVGQVPEVCRKAMLPATIQTLGKEEAALRKRPDDEIEQRIGVPCTANGQIASGEVNRYRFEARKGQKLVLSTSARRLIPYIADAVPGWFQPVLAVYDAAGKELAYDDDYRFNPDPTLLFEVPHDGEYVFTITDAIFRGREDFVYRVRIGEAPFVTSIFPLGAQAGTRPKIAMTGWNLEGAELAPPPEGAGPGIHRLAASRQGTVSNRVPFALDELPDGFDREANNDIASAQKVELPLIVNGRIDRPDDWDVFQFTGKAGDTVVAEVQARRLDSPLDSVLKLTDSAGKILAFNDDREDPGSGLNTHHADSYILAKLPADGAYFVHLGDAARAGGEAYGYRLRISPPRPDFELRVVPSSLALRGKTTTPLSVHVFRKDGFTDPIRLVLKDAPEGITSQPVSLTGSQEIARLTLKTTLDSTKEPLSLCVEGVARIGDREVARSAVPAEDRMQAFLWRHLVPTQDLKVTVFDPSYQPPAKRVSRIQPPKP